MCSRRRGAWKNAALTVAWSKTNEDQSDDGFYPRRSAGVTLLAPTREDPMGAAITAIAWGHTGMLGVFFLILGAVMLLFTRGQADD